MIRLLIFALFLLNGCENVTSAKDVVERGYVGLCERQPDSMSCIKHEPIGFSPSYSYLSSIRYELYNNTEYTTDKEQYNVDEYWFDNITIDSKLYGDCDDMALTFASQLILDGINPSSVVFVASGVNGVLKHYYVKVIMSNGKIFNAYRIEEYEDILYMRYNNVGVFKEVKEQLGDN